MKTTKTNINKTSRFIVYSLCTLFAICHLTSCQNTDSDKAQVNSTTQSTAIKSPATVTEKQLEKIESEELIETIRPFSVPILEFEASKQQVEKQYKQAIRSFEKEISQAKKIEKNMILEPIGQTAVSIWYINNKPVKVELTAPNDNGVYESILMYYLHKYKPWYAEDSEFRFIYNNDRVRFRFDKNWNAGRIRVSQFNQQKKTYRQIINQILSKE